MQSVTASKFDHAGSSIQYALRTLGLARVVTDFSYSPTFPIVTLVAYDDDPCSYFVCVRDNTCDTHCTMDKNTVSSFVGLQRIV